MHTRLNNAMWVLQGIASVHIAPPNAFLAHTDIWPEDDEFVCVYCQTNNTALFLQQSVQLEQHTQKELNCIVSGLPARIFRFYNTQ